MEKILERLGLYDIWIMLFPGMVFASGLKTLCNYMEKIRQVGVCTVNNSIGLQQLEIFYPTDIYGLFSFFVVSYLCGHILHELSSMAKKFIYKKGKPTELLLEERSNVLNSQQIQMYNQIFLKLNGDQEFSKDNFEIRRKESRNIFDIMNTELQFNGISSKYVKLNLI